MRFDVCVSYSELADLISDCAEKDFVGANLVQVLHTLLTEEHSAPEIKYNSMMLICSVMSSGEITKQHSTHAPGRERSPAQCSYCYLKLFSN